MTIAISLYFIGCIVAFFIGLTEALDEESKGEDISQFGAGIIVIIFLSWIYVIWWVSGLSPEDSD